jgi:hypothetical protein
MKTTPRQLMDLRKPYIKLIIVLGLITWFNDYQKIDDTTQQSILKFKEMVECCHTKDAPEKNPDSVICSFPIFQHFPNQATYEK